MGRFDVLTGEMWARIEPELPPLQGLMGRPMTPHRTVIENALFRLRMGIAWWDLSPHFGPWQTVWKRHAWSCRDGTWDRMLTVLLVEADAAGEIDWNVSVDSTVSRVRQHGATAARLELKPTRHTGGSIELQEIAS